MHPVMSHELKKSGKSSRCPLMLVLDPLQALQTKLILLPVGPFRSPFRYMI